MMETLRFLFLTGYCDATMLHGIAWAVLILIGYGGWHFIAGFIRGMRK